MANEIQLSTAPVITNANAVAIIRNASALVWNINTIAFETWTDGNIANYAAASLLQEGSSGFYVGSFPTAINNAGTYSISVYNKAGANLALSDLTNLIGEGSIIWSGTGEVPSPSGSGNLIDLATYKASQSISTTQWDALVTQLIPAASAAIQNYLHRDIVSTTYTDIVPGSDDFALLCKQYPVTDLISVTFDVYGNNPISVDGSNFFIDTWGSITLKPNNTSAFPYYAFGKGPHTRHQINYVAGYSTIPADIQDACVMLIKAKVSQLQNNPTLISEKIEDYQYQTRPYMELTPDIKEKLDPYRDRII